MKPNKTKFISMMVGEKACKHSNIVVKIALGVKGVIDIEVDPLDIYTRNIRAIVQGIRCKDCGEVMPYG
jgi:hypothetical protein